MVDPGDRSYFAAFDRGLLEKKKNLLSLTMRGRKQPPHHDRSCQSQSPASNESRGPPLHQTYLRCDRIQLFSQNTAMQR
jgi:hypothetical protein